MERQEIAGEGASPTKVDGGASLDEARSDEGPKARFKQYRLVHSKLGKFNKTKLQVVYFGPAISSQGHNIMKEAQRTGQ